MSANSKRTKPKSFAGRLVVRARTRLRAQELDLDLARGSQPDASAELALRAEQLSSPPSRAALARALDEAVDEAQVAPTPLVMRVPIRRRAVHEHSESLRQLAARLRADRPVDVQGVAIVHLLVTDGKSPLYWVAAPYSLGHVARAALGALEPMVALNSTRDERTYRLAASNGWPNAA